MLDENLRYLRRRALVPAMLGGALLGVAISVTFMIMV